MSGDRVHVEPGETLLTALVRQGLYLEADCGGHGRCRRCRVRIEEGDAPPAAEEERERLSARETKRGYRLACLFTKPGEYRVRRAHPVRFEPTEPPPGPATGLEAGLAADLGTTTVGASLIDLASGRRLGEAADRNPQIVYGEDVLERTRHGLAPEHRRRLAQLARWSLESLFATLLSTAGAVAGDVRTIAIAGNASMSMLLLGRDPAPLTRVPFEPGLAAEGLVSIPSGNLGFPPSTAACLVPAIGGHVGGDTTAAAIAAGLLTGERPALLIDLGTNGEVVLATEERALAASTAAGPAFEGGGITKGSRAVSGAIERIRIEDGGIRAQAVGGAPSASYCGSGVVEVTALLRDTGHIDATGRMVREPELPVPFTQADVRQVQLAKGAVTAAWTILCREAGISPDDLERIVLTGAFGSRVPVRAARAIGLIPARGPVESLSGGALRGAEMLLTPAGRTEARSTAAALEHVSLGEREDFQEVFVDSLALRDAER